MVPLRNPASSGNGVSQFCIGTYPIPTGKFSQVVGGGGLTGPDPEGGQLGRNPWFGGYGLPPKHGQPEFVFPFMFIFSF